MNLAGKNILVIGATRGIGEQIAAQAAQQGATVYTASRQASGANSVVVDTATSFAFEPGFLPNELHGLVYCPGSITLKPVNSLKPEAMLDEYNLNTVGALRALQAALPALKRGGNGSVVFFSTVAAKVGMPYHASIAAAKGGLEAMARSAAAELAQHKIRVNTLAPSLTDTPLAGSLLDTEDKRAAGGKRHPLGRVGTPAELAATACFLLSDNAAWITGQTLGVDGGMGSLK